MASMLGGCLPEKEYRKAGREKPKLILGTLGGRFAVKERFEGYSSMLPRGFWLRFSKLQ